MPPRRAVRSGPEARRASRARRSPARGRGIRRSRTGRAPAARPSVVDPEALATEALHCEHGMELDPVRIELHVGVEEADADEPEPSAQPLLGARRRDLAAGMDEGESGGTQ